ncbi:MAG: hypothetical protein HQ552_01725 [Desulfobacteraceae bacterium]|nr:hypothetical protein [Desulfobacteraceae bacterium]
MNLRGYDGNHNPFCLHTSQLFCVSVSPISAAVMVRTRLTRLCRQKAAKSYPYRCLRVCFGFFQVRRVFSQNKTIRPIALSAQVSVSKRTWMPSITNGEKGKFFTAFPAGRHGLPQHSFLAAAIFNEKINKICHPYQAGNFENS